MSNPTLVISRITPSNLSAESLQELSALTEQKFFCYFQGLHPQGISDTESYIFAASIDHQFVGLILASLVPVLRLGQVHSLYVLEKFRNQHIASKLLQKLQEELYKQSCLVLTIDYADDLPTLPSLEALLRKNHWDTPKNFQIQCEFDALKFNPPWLRTQPVLPPEFTEFSWSQLTPSEEQKLHFLESQSAFPASVSPFKPNAKKLETINSLGLKHKDKIIGWMITYRLSPTTIRYSSLFIFPEYQQLGIAIRLLSDAIIKHLEAGIAIGELEINLAQADITWLNFVKKRLMPYAQKITYIKQSWCHLKGLSKKTIE